jgi:hypothetical protein
MVVASDRLLNCARCQQQLRVCRRCDHGQRFCPDPCARQARRACVRAAGHRYQQTFRGRLHHARRQAHWRQRHCKKVTHQGFTSPCDSANVGNHEEVDAAAQAMAQDAPEPTRAGDERAIRRTQQARRVGTGRCAWCGWPAQRWVRWQRVRR